VRDHPASPKGNEGYVDVRDPEQLKNFKIGDHVQVPCVEDLAISVEETAHAK